MKMRSQTVRSTKTTSYVLVFEMKNSYNEIDIIIEIARFDGNQNIRDALETADVLTKALEIAHEWESEYIINNRKLKSLEPSDISEYFVNNRRIKSLERFDIIDNRCLQGEADKNVHHVTNCKCKLKTL